MPSIIEQVTQAEAQAASIKKEAQLQARELVAKAVQEASRIVEEAREQGRKTVHSAAEAAEMKGQELAEQVRREKAEEVDTQCMAAARKLPQAVEYILERIITV